jgi:hypothetical protein
MLERFPFEYQAPNCLAEVEKLMQDQSHLEGLNGRGRSRIWTAIKHILAAATKICCSRKSSCIIEMVLSGETGPNVDFTIIGDCKLHTELS